MKNTTISFDEARRKLPACCFSAWENLREDSGEDRLQDLIDAAKHELDLFHGIVKSFNARVAHVVYKCDGQWHRYQDFTGAATDFGDLRDGWL